MQSSVITNSGIVSADKSVCIHYARYTGRSTVVFLLLWNCIIQCICKKYDTTIAVAVVMSFNMGAFMSESIRGALLSVDEGQKEAAYSLGMTNFQLVTRIVIPQAVRVALPPLFNDIINLIKMTSLAFMLGVPDIMGAAKIEGARTFRYFEIYAAVMLVYWLIIFVLGILHKLLEKKCANMY